MAWPKVPKQLPNEFICDYIERIILLNPTPWEAGEIVNKNMKYLSPEQIDYLRTKADNLNHYEQVFYKQLYPKSIQDRMFH